MNHARLVPVVCAEKQALQPKPESVVFVYGFHCGGPGFLKLPSLGLGGLGALFCELLSS